MHQNRKSSPLTYLTLTAITIAALFLVTAPLAAQEVEKLDVDKVKQHIQVELQDADTDLIQTLDSETGFLKITVFDPETNSYQITTIGGTAAQDMSDGFEKTMQECAETASNTCNTVGSVTFEDGWFTDTCSFTCA